MSTGSSATSRSQSCWRSPLGASAVYSVVSIIARVTDERPLAEQSAALNPSRASREWLDFTYQFLDVFFGLFAVALVLYLLWQPGRDPFRRIGLDITRPGRDAASGLLLVAVIGVPGLALYAVGRRARIRRSPSCFTARHVLVDDRRSSCSRRSRRRSTEEVIVVGYLFTRLRELGVGPWATIVSSAVLRGTYHLYQGFGPFVGNARWESCSAGVYAALGAHDAARHRALDPRHRVVRRLPARGRVVAGALRRRPPAERWRDGCRGRGVGGTCSLVRERDDGGGHRRQRLLGRLDPQVGVGGAHRAPSIQLPGSACRRRRSPRRRRSRRSPMSLNDSRATQGSASAGVRRSSRPARFSSPRPLTRRACTRP